MNHKLEIKDSVDSFFEGVKPQCDDDTIDRLNYFYTPMLLIVFAVSLSAKQYAGNPIQCWIPAEFKDAWEEYSEAYCFAQNTYFIPIEQNIPSNVTEREAREIGYYQWVPFILCLQAICFYLPSILWRLLNWQSGLSIKSLVQTSKNISKLDWEERKAAVEAIPENSVGTKDDLKAVASHIQDSLNMSALMHQNSKIPFVNSGSYITVLYLVIKALYFVQVAVQLRILNAFLSTGYTFWGYSMLMAMLQGRTWEQSGHFPRVTMCDFEVRMLGNMHRHSVQCVLMINMYNEKVYLFLWWLLMAIAIATFCSLASWVVALMNESKKKEFIGCYLAAARLIDPEKIESDRYLALFLSHFLRSDGFFACRLLALNAGDLFVTQLLKSLWYRFGEDLEELTSKAVPPELGFRKGIKKN